MVVTQPYSAAIPRAAQQEVRDAFLARFKTRDFDGGLEEGVRAIEKVLADADRQGRLPLPAPTREPVDEAPPAAAGGPGSDLVVRNQVKLTLAGARRIIAGAEEKAAGMNLKVNIAVVDDGGHLLCFARMDGARPASGYTAITKATTAATLRRETGPLPSPSGDIDRTLLNLSLQNAAEASGGKITTLHGGVPVVVDGQVIGGVGVGGGTGEQDAEVAKAGISALLSRLDAPTNPEKDRKADDTGKPASPR
jgi:glc operon protein GlcG